MAILYLRASGTSLILDGRGNTLPRIVHWGADLGELTDADLVSLADAQRHQQVSNTQDDPVPLALVPEHSAGWLGTPGLSVHRDGDASSTRRSWWLPSDLDGAPSRRTRDGRGARARADGRAGDDRRRPAAPAGDGHQRRRRRRSWSTGSRSRSRCPRRRRSCSTSVAGTCASGARSGTRSPTARTCARTAEAAPAPTRRW